jgi:hypothetical protein
VTSQTFVVTIRDDVLVEAAETIPLSLTAIGDTVVQGNGTAVLTILDDEPPPPGVLQFSAMDYSVSEGGGFATITVSRTGGSAGPVAVAYATSGGTATPGQDYTSVSGVLNFAAGQTSLSFTVPILDDAQTEGSETIGLVLGSPAGTGLGPQAMAVLTIQDNDVDRVPPRVVDVRLISGPRGIDRIEVEFSEPMRPETVIPANFRVVSAGRDGRLGTRDDRVIPIRSVLYTPGSTTATLILGRTVPRGQFLQVSFLAGLTDRAGNRLDGNGDGIPGDDFVQSIGQASTLRYQDADGDLVTLTLRGGGSLQLVGTPVGGRLTGVSVLVVNPRPFGSAISGSVRRAGGGDGTTTLESIRGLGDFGEVRSTLTSPPFFVRQQPTVTVRALDAALASDDTLGGRDRRGRGV